MWKGCRRSPMTERRGRGLTPVNDLDAEGLAQADDRGEGVVVGTG